MARPTVPMVEFPCAQCGKTGRKTNAEYRRSLRMGRLMFCGTTCAAVHNNAHREVSPKVIERIRALCGNRHDDYYNFRFHLKVVKQRLKVQGVSCELTLRDLADQWEKQEGRCPYTGWELDNPGQAQPGKSIEKHPRRASLDRIDSSKGYVIGNIEFVSMIANFAKNDWPREAVIEFGRAVSKQHP